MQLAVDINEVIADVLSFARSELLAKDISVRLALLEGLPCIIGDRVQLQQVVLNLVVNAIEAMASVTDRERMLAITSQRAVDGSPIVTIEDSGLGLDAGNWNVSSTPSSPPSRAAWAWACRSAHRLSKPMEAASGRRRTCHTAPRFMLSCRLQAEPKPCRIKVRS